MIYLSLIAITFAVIFMIKIFAIKNTNVFAFHQVSSSISQILAMLTSD